MLERDESTMVLRENRFDCSDFPDSALIYYFLVQITAWSLWLNTLVQGFQRRRKTERNESSSTMFGKSDSDRWYSWNLVEKYYSSKRQWTSFSIKRLIQQMNDYNEIRPRKKKKKFVRSLRQEDNRGTIRATCAQYTLLTRNASGNWKICRRKNRKLFVCTRKKLMLNEILISLVSRMRSFFLPITIT